VVARRKVYEKKRGECIEVGEGRRITRVGVLGNGRQWGEKLGGTGGVWWGGGGEGEEGGG